ncbi:MAG: class I tRNA ligase family protein [Anaerolineae bacterium]|nr:class I tRNA ligase family protein [Anaerolineae bacterium]
MADYDFRAFERRWQARWDELRLFQCDTAGAAKPPSYCLMMFPYPSGDLHVGHGRNYLIGDTLVRHKLMQGYEVLSPMGWDAFGLPAENEAIYQGVHPSDSIARYTANYRRQMTRLGCSYDWEREIWSCAPDYYRWTQWIFLTLYERGLAYRAHAPVNWCPGCQTVLANEEVEAGVCWRCGSVVEEQVRPQWFFRITAYADRLRDGLARVDWPDHIKALQLNWLPTLHDWLISRQRYWGTPIPIVHCEQCGMVPVPCDQLPVRLPPIQDYRPHGDGQSPLANVAEFVHTPCPQCGRPARRETDTMGGTACSSWYFLRFANPGYTEGPFDPEAVRAWLPVDLYVGGAEQAVSHLLYARFWTQALHDAGLLDFDEPFPRLRSQGVLHAPDGKRMSKSRRNIVSPDEIIDRASADALRLHILFMAPFDEPATWNSDGLVGIERFLRRVWEMTMEGGRRWTEASRTEDGRRRTDDGPTTNDQQPMTNDGRHDGSSVIGPPSSVNGPPPPSPARTHRLIQRVTEAVENHVGRRSRR